MEAELWATRMAKRHLLSSQFLFDASDDLDGDEDIRTEFACPYCSEEFDIATLCSHMEDEHCDGKLTMCPVCTLRIGGNEVVSHITAQHAYLFKAQCRRRLRKPKDLSSRLSAILGSAHRPSSNSSSIPSSDVFLSSLVGSFPFTEEEGGSKPLVESLDKETLAPRSVPEEPGLTTEERERRAKQAASRAQFVQHIVLSALWPDS